jgi:hypothetical protein
MTKMNPTQAYGTGAAPTVTHQSESDTGSNTGSQYSTAEATTTSHQISPSSTSHPSQTSIIDYNYEEVLSLNGIPTILTFSWDSVAEASFGGICPSGNCLEACQDYVQVFQTTPDTASQASNITLFGVCSNLGMIYGDLYNTNASVMQKQASYFPPGDQSHAVVTQVISSLSSCLAGSCETSRDPHNCNASCSLSILNYGNSTMNMATVGQCFSELCSNTCGLPYADQDVYGVGVSI